MMKFVKAWMGVARRSPAEEVEAPGGGNGDCRRKLWVVRDLRWATLSVAAALAASGCNRSGLNLAPVEGVVTLDGTPVAEAGVVFSPTDPRQGPPAMGTTDATGRFTLQTANADGAPIGEHRVAISKADAFGEEIPEEKLDDPEFARRRGFRAYKTKHFVPPNYANVETSGLTASVKDSDDNKFEFKLEAPKASKRK